MIREMYTHFTRNSLLKNSSYIFLTSILTSGMGFLFWYLAAKIFTPAEVGTGQLFISGMLSVVAVSLVGFNISLLRFLPTERDKKKLINTCVSISVGTSIVISIIYLATLDRFIPEQVIFQGIGFEALFILFTASWTFGVLLDTIYTALRHTSSILARNGVMSVTKILALFTPLGPTSIFYGWGIGSLIANAYTLLFSLPKYLSHRFAFEIDLMKFREIGKLSFSNYLSWGFNYIAIWAFGFLLANYFSVEQTGYFSIAWNIASLSFVASLSIAQSLISEAAHDIHLQQKHIRKALKYLSIFMIPGVIIGVVLRTFILGLFSPAYVIASDAFGILLASALVVSVVNIYLALQNINNHPQNVFYINIIRLAGMGVLAFILTPRYGMEGAALAWMGSNIIVLPWIIPPLVRTLTTKKENA